MSGETPAAVIASATTPKQRVFILTLEKLAAAVRAQNIEPPAIVVIGEIVKAAVQRRAEGAVAEKDSP